jgi:hypothetical protein
MTDRSTPPVLPQEDAALLETLTPELARLLYPDQTTEPFLITVVYPELRGEAGQAARRIESSAAEHSITKPQAEGRDPVHRTTFSLAQVEEFHELYHLAETTIGGGELELLLNGRRVPFARELWLPLIWSLRK